MTEWTQEDTDTLHDAMRMSTTMLRRVAHVIGARRLALIKERNRLNKDIDRVSNNLKRIHDAIIATNIVMSIRRSDDDVR